MRICPTIPNPSKNLIQLANRSPRASHVQPMGRYMSDTVTFGSVVNDNGNLVSASPKSQSETEQAKAERIRQVIQEASVYPIRLDGRTQITGCHILQVLVSRAQDAAKLAGKLTTTLSSKDIYNTFSTEQRGSVSTGDIEKAIDSMQRIGWVTERNLYQYCITQAGTEFLKREHPNMAAQVELNQRLQSLPSSQGLLDRSIQTSRKISTTNLNDSRINRLEALISENKTGVTGWQVLKTMDALEHRKWAIPRYFYPGIQLETLLSKIGGDEDSKGSRRIVKLLKDAGLMAWKLNAPGALLVLTSEGQSALRRGNPLETNHLSDSDNLALVGRELKRLENERSNRKQDVQSIEKDYQQAMLNVEAIEKEYQNLEDDALGTYEKSQLISGITPEAKKEKEFLELQAGEKALMAKQFIQKLEGEKKLLSMHQLQVQTAKAAYRHWSTKMEHNVETLQQAEIQLRATAIQRNISGFMNELNELDLQPGLDSQNHTLQIVSLLNQIRNDFDISKGDTNQNEIQAQLAAAEAVKEISLAKQMEALQQRKEQRQQGETDAPIVLTPKTLPTAASQTA